MPTLLATMRRSYGSRRSSSLLLQLMLLLLLTITLYSAMFLYLMELEGHKFSFITAVYWTLTTMTTLGYGDIVFRSGLGQAFTIVVLLSGILFVFIVLPFTFIESFYASWVRAYNEAQAPRELPRRYRGHVILTSADPVSTALIRKLERYRYSYALIVPDHAQALPLAERGLKVMVGELDNPETYRQAHIEIASLVAVTSEKDSLNANVALTVRQIAPQIPLIALARYPESVEILQLAGATHILQPIDRLGQSLARRAYGGEQRAHVIAEFDSLMIAEATVRDTPLVGQTVEQTHLRTAAGVAVLGAWQRGQFTPAGPSLQITQHSVIVLAGSVEQIARFNQLYPQPRVSDKPVVVIGGGGVGQATGQALLQMGIDFRMIEKVAYADLPEGRTVLGNAARYEVLARAGIADTPTVIITTHDDDINIYLTIYLRSLRPDLTIISRSMHERNLATLHRAGADFVMSHGSMAANAIFNLLKRSNIEMVAEGLDIFRLPVSPKLAGRSLADVDLRRKTGCTLIALQTERGMQVNPDPHAPLPVAGEMLLLATVEDEAGFLAQYPLKAEKSFRQTARRTSL